MTENVNPEATTDDVEGHRLNTGGAPVGSFQPARDLDDDVEGHKVRPGRFAPDADGDDDVQGHIKVR
jgi:hypothetical protein